MKDISSTPNAIDELCSRIVASGSDSSNAAPVTDDMVAAALREIETDQSLLATISDRLTLPDHLEAGDLYDRLSSLDSILPHSKFTHPLLGELWSHLYASASEETRERLVSGFISEGDFFSHYYALPRIIQTAELSGRVLADWFRDLEIKTANDNGMPIFHALATLAEGKPTIAVELLSLWTSELLSESIISMAAHLLGHLRHHHSAEAEEIEKALQASDSQERRKVFYRSWASYDEPSPLKATKYCKVIDSMTGNTEAERDEALTFIRRTISESERCDKSFTHAIRWLHSNLPSEPSGSWQYWIIALAVETRERIIRLKLTPLHKTVPALLPLEQDHKGTRQKLDELLAQLWKSDQAEFSAQIFALSERDRYSLDELFNPHEHREVLNAIAETDSTEVAATFLLSRVASVRRVGLKIFQRNVADRLPSIKGKPWDREQIARVIFQLGAETAFDFPVAPLMAALAEHVQQCDDKRLNEVFVEQLILHMKNFPGACLDAIKKRNKNLQSPLLKKAITQANRYFRGTKKCRGSAINSMQIFGHRRAFQMLSNRQDHAIQQASEGEGSLMALIATKSYLLYGGREWQRVVGGTLSSSSWMQEFSNSMELPRMPMLDPEGFYEWRLRCRQSMRGLDKKATDHNPETEEGDAHGS